MATAVRPGVATKMGRRFGERSGFGSWHVSSYRWQEGLGWPKEDAYTDLIVSYRAMVRLSDRTSLNLPPFATSVCSLWSTPSLCAVQAGIT
jgi:hypothetical protein